MRKIAYLFLCLLPTLAFADSSKVVFNNGWIKQLPPVVPMRAGYMNVSNPTDTAVEILSVESSAFESVEMHETMMEDGMMKMVEQHSMVIPAKGSLELKPGGKHLMLIAPLYNLELGDRVELTVTFGDAKTQLIQLEVKK